MGAEREGIELLGIAASLRGGRSANRRLLEIAAERLDEETELRIVPTLDLVRLPRFQPHREMPQEVALMRDLVAVADGLLVATPELNGSVPGVLKDLIDWCTEVPDGSVLDSKPVAVIGADRDGFGGDWGQAEARKVLDTAGAFVMAQTVSVPYAARAFDADGQLRDAEVGARLDAAVAALCEAARMLSPRAGGAEQPA